MKGKKPSTPERGNGSGGGDGASNVGRSTFTGRGSTTKEGGNPSNGRGNTITEEDVGANASPSVPNSIGQPGFKPAVQQGTVHLPEQQQGVTTGRWSRKRPGSHPAMPTLLPWQSTQPPSLSTGQHRQPLPWQQKDPTLSRETRMEQGAGRSRVERKEYDLSENLMEFSITPEQLQHTARTAGSETGRGGGKTRRGESEQDEGRQSDYTLADRVPHPQSEDLITFSVVPRAPSLPMLRNFGSRYKTTQGVGSTFMKSESGSEDAGTRPEGGQRRVPSSGQMAVHPAPDRQIDPALIEG